MHHRGSFTLSIAALDQRRSGCGYWRRCSTRAEERKSFRLYKGGGRPWVILRHFYKRINLVRIES